MAITRRELLGRCSMWAALAAMPSALSVMADAEMTAPPAALSKEMFASLKGSSFEVTSGSTRQALTLVSVDDISEGVRPDRESFDVAPPKSAPTRKLTTFSLRFYGGVKRLKQGTYSFQHESTGQFNLFIVPTGGKQFFYTAIFNRL